MHAANTYKLHEGYKKISGFCDFIVRHRPDIRWLWIDSCCINQADFTELSEAINSMYKWYKHSEVCIACMKDVESGSNMTRSVWFKRGWTLQELVAPRLVVFAIRDWTIVGAKLPTNLNSDGLGNNNDSRDIERTERRQFLAKLTACNSYVSSITGAPEYVLWDFRSRKRYSVETRLDWMNGRKTTKPEDLIYSQMGMFGVHMPLIYGEGRVKALRRLEREISLRKQYSALTSPERPTRTSVEQETRPDFRQVNAQQLQFSARSSAGPMTQASPGQATGPQGGQYAGQASPRWTNQTRPGPATRTLSQRPSQPSQSLDGAYRTLRDGSEGVTSPARADAVPSRPVSTAYAMTDSRSSSYQSDINSSGPGSAKSTTHWPLIRLDYDRPKRSRANARIGPSMEPEYGVISDDAMWKIIVRYQEYARSKGLTVPGPNFSQTQIHSLATHARERFNFLEGLKDDWRDERGDERSEDEDSPEIG